MNERIRSLREKSLAAVPRISCERAMLLTESYKANASRNISVPVQRAMAFQHIMMNKSLYLGSDELIVGERGPEPAAVPTYPDICTHSLEDLDILNSRDKISYKVLPKTRKCHEEVVLPFWQGSSQRDRIFQNMSPEWLAAYEAGIFTEFQEQRTPGHTALGDKIFKKGFLDLKTEIDDHLDRLVATDPETPDKREELKAI